MSSEPRMRGKRFVRPASKKSSRRVRESENTEPYLDVKEVDPAEVTSAVLNAIDHLGNQRFVLPPFAEHFERWLKDLQSLLNEFETQIPQAVDGNLHMEITGSMNNIRNVLAKCTEVENTKSSESTKLQQQLARCETALSQLEHTYKSQTQELRRQYEKANQKVRAEIDQLDRRRMQILRKHTNIFQRIFRKSDTAIQGTNTALESRRTELSDSGQSLKKDLQRRREEYTTDRQRLLTEIEGLRQKIHGLSESSRDDALEARREACQRIHMTITGAMQKAQTDLGSGSPSSSP